MSMVDYASHLSKELLFSLLVGQFVGMIDAGYYDDTSVLFRLLSPLMISDYNSFDEYNRISE